MNSDISIMINTVCNTTFTYKIAKINICIINYFIKIITRTVFNINFFLICF